MKKILTFGLLVAASFSANAAKTYWVTQQNTKPWGCASSKETSDENNIWLVCTDPGEKICEFSDGNCPKGITSQSANELVYGKIAAGLLDGTVDLGNGTVISWHGESVDNFGYSVTEN